MFDLSNINPQLWGPYGWKFLHYITLAYPNNPTDKDKLNMYTFFTSLANVLPCHKCKVHFAQYLQEFPINEVVLSSKTNVANWLLNIHNQINIKHNKPQYTLDMLYDELIINPSYPQNDQLYVIIILIVAFFIILFLCIIRR